MRNILKGKFLLSVYTVSIITLSSSSDVLLSSDLMSENHVLRGLLRSLSGFIGDGAGGLLPKLGWTQQDFENFVNRSETDTAWEGYQRRKQDSPITTGTSGSQSGARKRPSEDDINGRNKKSRGPGDREDGDRGQESFPVLVPMGAATSSNNLYSSTSRSSHENNLLSDLLRGPTGSPMFVANSSNSTTPAYGTSSSQVTSSAGNYQAPYLASLNMNVESPMNSMSFMGSTPAPPVTQTRMTQNMPSMEDGDELDPKGQEAQKLISCAKPPQTMLTC